MDHAAQNPDPEDPAEVIGQKGVEGNGRQTFEADPGDYTVTFVMHGAVGKATVACGKS